jgi:thiamine transport system substrate-binding protein
MYVYPINEAIQVPEAWAKFAPPAETLLGEGLDINANRDQWLADWSEVFDN